MGKENKKQLIIATVLSLALAILPARNASGQADSLVRLMNAKSIEQAELDGVICRKAIEATFLHNGTYLSCDTSFWNVDQKIINCFGNVQLIQGESLLTSEKLDYYIDRNLAEFRGPVVQMTNDQNNILRTRHLDYNTRDSLAVFMNGASMRSKDGQVIESDEGNFYTSDNLFRFKGNVNMFTDSVFVKTDSLDYYSKTEKAVFTTYIDFWKDDNMLSAGGGWYDRSRDIFFFNKDVHALSPTQECWSDSLYYYRIPNDLLMRSNVQVQDTSRNVAGMSHYLMYCDSLSLVTMKDNASIAMWTQKDEKLDTVYCGAQTITYQTRRKCDIHPSEITSAETRLKDISGDAVSDYRKRASEEAAKANEEAKKNNANFAAQFAKPSAGKGLPSKAKPSLEADKGIQRLDSLSAKTTARDSLSLADSLNLADSLALTDSLNVEQPKDTSKIGFIAATKEVRIYRTDMQVLCDSLVFNELDSIARLYKGPIVWNETNRQYSADSLFVLVKKGGPDRANLMSNAFIAIQEDELHFDQIKSSEVMAYFDSTAALRRFDALGGADAMFFLNENDTLSTVNKVQSQMLSAKLKDGNLDQVFYFQSPKNDAYPIVQLPSEEMKMKGFFWKPELRPTSKNDVTTLEIKESEREYYESRPTTVFVQTDTYFPGYMAQVYKDLELAKERKELSKSTADTLKAKAADASDLAVSDSLQLADSSALATADSLAVSDSLKSEEASMSERELKRALRIARRDARWSALDSRDVAKSELKKARQEARRLKRQERLDKIQAKQDAANEVKLQKYIRYFQKQKEKDERRKEQLQESSGERPQGVEAGGVLSSASTGQ